MSGEGKMLTIPNLLTLVRALGIPVFLWLIYSQQNSALAVIVLMIGGATDYFDGKLARALGQESRFGELMDPTVDRLYIAAVLIALYSTDAVSVWVLLTIVLRDLLLALLLLAMKFNGIPPLTVTYLGKAATFNLLYALPLLLLQQSTSTWVASTSFIFGWAFASWGIALYLITGVSYAKSGISMIASERARGR
jgi:cardiolipin synthase